MMPVMDRAGSFTGSSARADPRPGLDPRLRPSRRTRRRRRLPSTPKAYLRKPIDWEQLLWAAWSAPFSAERRKLHAGTLVEETEPPGVARPLAAGVAHEINNPLAYVMANCDYIALAMDKCILSGEGASIREALYFQKSAPAASESAPIVNESPAPSRACPTKERPLSTCGASSTPPRKDVVLERDPRARAADEGLRRGLPLIKASAARLGQVFLSLF